MGGAEAGGKGSERDGTQVARREPQVGGNEARVV